MARNIVEKAARLFGLVTKTIRLDVTTAHDPIKQFHADHYLRHNARRLEHLASMGIPTRGKTVLEVGAGIGDHSHYYLDRQCTVTITEARQDNLKALRRRYPTCDIRFLDMEKPSAIDGGPFDIVHCYGLIYHLSEPGEALKFLASQTRCTLLLETCVSFGDNEAINSVQEPKKDPTQAVSGTGCRPTRPWIFNSLRRLFPFVYVPRTQPNHEEFPLDWTQPELHKGNLARAVFIGSREILAVEALLPNLPSVQIRHQ